MNMLCRMQPLKRTTHTISWLAVLTILFHAERSQAIDIEVASYGNLTPAQRSVVDAKVQIWEAYFPKSPGHIVSLTFNNADLGAVRLAPIPGVEFVRGTEGTTLAQTGGFTEDVIGRPTGASITINNNAAVSWYTGLTGPVPAGQTDLYTVLNHEICHALGFTINNSRFNDHVTENSDGSRTYNDGGNPTATLTPEDEGTHLDPTAHPNDLMNPTIPAGQRRTASPRDRSILEHAIWSDDCRTTNCGGPGVDCDLTFISCFNDTTQKITHTVHNNQLTYNICFVVEGLGMSSNDLEDETSLVNSVDGVATASVVSDVRICCGDNISATPATCDNCNEVICSIAKYWQEDSDKCEARTSFNSTFGTDDGSIAVVCTAERSGDIGDYAITYACTNNGIDEVLVDWSGTPFETALVFPGETISEEVSGIAFIECAFAHLDLDDGSYVGRATAIRPVADIPTVSEWGLMVTVLLLATAGTILYGRRRPATA